MKRRASDWLAKKERACPCCSMLARACSPGTCSPRQGSISIQETLCRCVGVLGTHRSSLPKQVHQNRWAGCTRHSTWCDSEVRQQDPFHFCAVSLRVSLICCFILMEVNTGETSRGVYNYHTLRGELSERSLHKRVPFVMKTSL